MEVLKNSIALVVAGMDSMSIVAFTWRYFYVYQPWYIPFPLALLLFAISIGSVFYLSFYGSNRNIKKVNAMRLSQYHSKTQFLFHGFLSALQAFMAYITKRFALLVLFPKGLHYQLLVHFLPIVYATYIFFNSLKDLLKSTRILDKTQSTDYIQDILNTSIDDAVLLGSLLFASILTCHYKILALNISIAGLIQKLGENYRVLRYTQRFFYFPMVMVAYHNAFSCKEQIIKALFSNTATWGWQQYTRLSVMFIAAYTHATSSKLLSLTTENILPIIMVDRFANYIRQSGEFFNPPKP